MIKKVVIPKQEVKNYSLTLSKEDYEKYRENLNQEVRWLHSRFEPKSVELPVEENEVKYSEVDISGKVYAINDGGIIKTFSPNDVCFKTLHHLRLEYQVTGCNSREAFKYWIEKHNLDIYQFDTQMEFFEWSLEQLKNQPKYTVKVGNSCIACGACESICDAVFEVYDKVEVRQDKVTEYVDTVREAIECCPISILKLEKI